MHYIVRTTTLSLLFLQNIFYGHFYILVLKANPFLQQLLIIKNEHDVDTIRIVDDTFR